MKRARQGVGRTLAAAVLVLMVVLPLLAVGVWITAMIFDRMRVELYWPAIASMATLKWAALSVPALGIGPAMGYLVRDWYLRRSVRLILTTQGHCPGCGYNVLGLRLSEQSSVRCPECGLETVVDPSLGELVLDAKGRHVTIVNGQRVGRVERSKNWKRWRRVLIGLASLVIVVMPAVLGLNEVFVRRQAGRAKADLVVLEQAMRDLIVSLQTAPQGPSAWAPLMKASERVADAEREIQRRPRAFVGTEWNDIDQLRLMTASNRIENGRGLQRVDPDTSVATMLRGHAALGLLAECGLFQELTEASRRGCTLPWDQNGALLDPVLNGAPLTVLLSPNGHYPQLTTSRMWQLVSFCNARMAVGARAGKREMVLSGYEQGLALFRISSEMPFDTLRGLRSLHAVQAGAALVLNPELGLAAGMRESQKRLRSSTRVANKIESGRLYWQYQVASIFQDPAYTRWGRWSKPYVDLMNTSRMSASRLGTYDENVALVNAFHDATSQHVRGGGDLGSYVWLPSADPMFELPGPVQWMPSSFSFWGYVEDRVQTCDAGLEAVLSITEFRASKGRLPESLDEVAAWKGEALPMDPMTGKPLVYRVLQRGPEREVLTYRLLSVGKNGVEESMPAGPPVLPSGSSIDDLVFVDGYEVAR